MRADHKREELDVHLIALLKVDLDLLILDPLDLTGLMGLETRHRDVDRDVLALRSCPKQNHIYPIPTPQLADTRDGVCAGPVHRPFMITSGSAAEALPHVTNYLDDRVMPPIFVLPLDTHRRMNARARQATSTSANSMIPPLTTHATSR